MTNTDIEQLTPEERLELIARLWESLDPPDVPLPDDHRAELDRRLDRIEQEGPHTWSVDELEAHLRKRRER